MLFFQGPKGEPGSPVSFIWFIVKRQRGDDNNGQYKLTKVNCY